MLEHEKEDISLLHNIFKALKPGGFLFVTIPQHTWLWSDVDEYSCHVRRYDASDIHQKLKWAGFKTVRSTSFVSTLLPAMYLQRLFQRGRKINGGVSVNSGLRINPLLNRVFEWFLYLELVLIRLGVSLPAGGSRLVISKKPKYQECK